MSYIDHIAIGSDTYDIKDSVSTAEDMGALPSVLTSDYYGTALPTAGIEGRIFFLKV